MNAHCNTKVLPPDPVLGLGMLLRSCLHDHKIPLYVGDKRFALFRMRRLLWYTKFYDCWDIVTTVYLSGGDFALVGDKCQGHSSQRCKL